jgi:hypothetical protein
MNTPKSKYEIEIYKFGQILEKHYHDEGFEESYWSYKMIKAGKNYPFWYSEEEIEQLENGV